MKEHVRIWSILMAMSLTGCASSGHYAIYQFENGDDYFRDGLQRITDRHGRIGYADEHGKVVIKPRFACAFPFENGRAKVADKGKKKDVPGSRGEYHYWESDEWYYVDKKGHRIKSGK